MNWLTNFIATHKLSSHAIVAALGSGATVYSTVQPVKIFVDGLLAGHKTLSAALAALVGILLTYMGSHNTAGVQQMAIQQRDAAAMRDEV